MIVLKNIVRTKLRSGLTLLGVAVGISVFFTLTTFGDGLKGQVRHLIRSYKVDLLVKTRESSSPLSSAIPLSDYRKLAAMDVIEDASALLLGPIRQGKNNYFLINGVSSMGALAGRIGLTGGRLPRPGTAEMMLGADAAKTLGHAVGDTVLLGTHGRFAIVGVYVSGSRLFDRGAVVDIEVARRILNKGDVVNMALVRLREGIGQDDAAAAIEREFPSLVALRSGDVIGHIELINSIDVISAAMAFIALVTCCIVVTNTLMMSITERTREIGILMAVGWSGLRIMATIALESTILCAVGGLSGVLMGYSLLWIFNAGGVTGLDWVPVTFSAVVVGKSVLISLLLGVTSAFYPAIVASRLSPAQALRV